MRYAQSKKMWVTSLRDLKSWWIKRQGVEVRYDSRSKRRIAVELSNPTDQKTDAIIVQVNLNRKVKNIQVSSDIINTDIPKYELGNDQQTLNFYLEKMEPHESRSLIVDYDLIGA
jgi:hypothetical protein